MDPRQFDRFARALAGGGTRRSFVGGLGRLAGGLTGGALALRAGSQAVAQGNQGGDDDPPGNSQCREEGHPCEGNQVCCEGLVCVASGPGNAERCTRECEADCPEEASAEETSADVTIVVARSYRIEADCAYDDEADETTCSCTTATEGGDADSDAVVGVLLPTNAFAAEVIGGDVELVCAGDTRVAAYASASASFSVVLAGNVTADGTADWWCQTDAGLAPAQGPSLIAAAADDVTDAAGAVLVYASACDGTPGGETVDWYGACAAPATDLECSLDQAGEQGGGNLKRTNRGGRARYGRVEPGTYRLTVAGGNWCHAECDNVDEDGGVVVSAGRRTRVWVFACS